MERKSKIAKGGRGRETHFYLLPGLRKEGRREKGEKIAKGGRWRETHSYLLPGLRKEGKSRINGERER